MSGQLSAEVSLHPEHLTDLCERSGLSDHPIRTAGIHSLAPAEWARYLSQRLAAEVTVP